jgi:hypothetical protein
LVERGQNATGQHLSSAFWHDNSSAAGKESEIGHDGIYFVGIDEPKDGSSSHEQIRSSSRSRRAHEIVVGHDAETQGRTGQGHQAGLDRI